MPTRSCWNQLRVIQWMLRSAHIIAASIEFGCTSIRDNSDVNATTLTLRSAANMMIVVKESTAAGAYYPVTA